jgi:hypothetical protein
MGISFDFKLGSAYSQAMRMGRVATGILLATLVSSAPVLGEDKPKTEETQPSESKPENKPTETKAPAQEAPTSGMEIGEVSKISNEEKQTRSEKALAEERDAMRRVTEILSTARQSKDIVQLNCVNEKLTQIKGLLRISEDASSRMYDAIGAGTKDVIDHEFTKIAVAHQKCLTLRAEAEQCVGEFSVYTGETEITVEVPPGEENPTNPTQQPPGPEVPPFGSRF